VRAVCFSVPGVAAALFAAIGVRVVCSGGWASTPIRGPFLIIAPLSTLSHWQRELAAWTSLNAVMYHGNATARDVIFKHEWSHAYVLAILLFYRLGGYSLCGAIQIQAGVVEVRCGCDHARCCAVDPGRHWFGSNEVRVTHPP
jgi:hypothetical protein